MSGLTVVLVLLAVYRGTLLVTSDRITRTPRRRLREWLRRRAHHLDSADQDGDGFTRYRCSCGWSVQVVEQTGQVAISYPVPEGVQIPAGPLNQEIRKAWITGAIAGHQRDADSGRLGYLIECPWCVSIYLGAIGAAVAWAWPHGWWRWPALALAASAAAGFLSTLAAPDNLDDED